MVGWCLFGTWCAPASADGGSMRMTGEVEGYQISVFTAPVPFRAGPVDVSVLVQDSRTGEPMPQARVSVRMTKPGQPAIEQPATSEAASNKLFRAAQFELPDAGRWEMRVQVQGPHGLAVIGGDVEAAEHLPRWREVWPWFGWPALAVALFSIHQVLVRRSPGAVRFRASKVAPWSVSRDNRSAHPITGRMPSTGYAE
jgi:hypothetical protein